VSNRDIKLENTLLEAQHGRRPMLKLCGEWPRTRALAALRRLCACLG
jgi:hypothetical protein